MIIKTIIKRLYKITTHALVPSVGFLLPTVFAETILSPAQANTSSTSSTSISSQLQQVLQMNTELTAAQKQQLLNLATSTSAENLTLLQSIITILKASSSLTSTYFLPVQQQALNKILISWLPSAGVTVDSTVLTQAQQLATQWQTVTAIIQSDNLSTANNQNLLTTVITSTINPSLQQEVAYIQSALESIHALTEDNSVLANQRNYLNTAILNALPTQKTFSDIWVQLSEIISQDPNINGNDVTLWGAFNMVLGSFPSLTAADAKVLEQSLVNTNNVMLYTEKLVALFNALNAINAAFQNESSFSTQKTGFFEQLVSMMSQSNTSTAADITNLGSAVSTIMATQNATINPVIAQNRQNILAVEVGWEKSIDSKWQTYYQKFMPNLLNLLLENPLDASNISSVTAALPNVYAAVSTVTSDYSNIINTSLVSLLRTKTVINDVQAWVEKNYNRANAGTLLNNYAQIFNALNQLQVLAQLYEDSNNNTLTNNLIALESNLSINQSSQVVYFADILQTLLKYDSLYTNNFASILHYYHTNNGSGPSTEESSYPLINDLVAYVTNNLNSANLGATLENVNTVLTTFGELSSQTNITLYTKINSTYNNLSNWQGMLIEFANAVSRAPQDANAYATAAKTLAPLLQWLPENATADNLTQTQKTVIGNVQKGLIDYTLKQVNNPNLNTILPILSTMLQFQYQNMPQGISTAEWATIMATWQNTLASSNANYTNISMAFNDFMTFIKQFNQLPSIYASNINAWLSSISTSLQQSNSSQQITNLNLGVNSFLSVLLQYGNLVPDVNFSQNNVTQNWNSVVTQILISSLKNPANSQATIINLQQLIPLLATIQNNPVLNANAGILQNIIVTAIVNNPSTNLQLQTLSTALRDLTNLNELDAISVTLDGAQTSGNSIIMKFITLALNNPNSTAAIISNLNSLPDVFYAIEHSPAMINTQELQSSYVNYLLSTPYAGAIGNNFKALFILGPLINSQFLQDAGLTQAQANTLLVNNTFLSNLLNSLQTSPAGWQQADLIMNNMTSVNVSSANAVMLQDYIVKNSASLSATTKANLLNTLIYSFSANDAVNALLSLNQLNAYNLNITPAQENALVNFIAVNSGSLDVANIFKQLLSYVQYLNNNPKSQINVNTLISILQNNQSNPNIESYFTIVPQTISYLENILAIKNLNLSSAQINSLTQLVQANNVSSNLINVYASLATNLSKLNRFFSSNANLEQYKTSAVNTLVSMALDYTSSTDVTVGMNNFISGITALNGASFNNNMSEVEAMKLLQTSPANAINIANAIKLALFNKNTSNLYAYIENNADNAQIFQIVEDYININNTIKNNTSSSKAYTNLLSQLQSVMLNSPDKALVISQVMPLANNIITELDNGNLYSSNNTLTTLFANYVENNLNQNTLISTLENFSQWLSALKTANEKKSFSSNFKQQLVSLTIAILEANNVNTTKLIAIIPNLMLAENENIDLTALFSYLEANVTTLPENLSTMVGNYIEAEEGLNALSAALTQANFANAVSVESAVQTYLNANMSDLSDFALITWNALPQKIAKFNQTISQAPIAGIDWSTIESVFMSKSIASPAVAPLIISNLVSLPDLFLQISQNAQDKVASQNYILALINYFINNPAIQNIASIGDNYVKAVDGIAGLETDDISSVNVNSLTETLTTMLQNNPANAMAIANLSSHLKSILLLAPYYSKSFLQSFGFSDASATSLSANFSAGFINWLQNNDNASAMTALSTFAAAIPQLNKTQVSLLQQINTLNLQLNPRSKMQILSLFVRSSKSNNYQGWLENQTQIDKGLQGILTIITNYPALTVADRSSLIEWVAKYAAVDGSLSNSISALQDLLKTLSTTTTSFSLHDAIALFLNNANSGSLTTILNNAQQEINVLQQVEAISGLNLSSTQKADLISYLTSTRSNPSMLPFLTSVKTALEEIGTSFNNSNYIDLKPKIISAFFTLLNKYYNSSQASADVEAFAKNINIILTLPTNYTNWITNALDALAQNPTNVNAAITLLPSIFATINQIPGYSDWANNKSDFKNAPNIINTILSGDAGLTASQKAYLNRMIPNDPIIHPQDNSVYENAILAYILQNQTNPNLAANITNFNNAFKQLNQELLLNIVTYVPPSIGSRYTATNPDVLISDVAQMYFNLLINNINAANNIAITSKTSLDSQSQIGKIFASLALYPELYTPQGYALSPFGSTIYGTKVMINPLEKSLLDFYFNNISSPNISQELQKITAAITTIGKASGVSPTAAPSATTLAGMKFYFNYKGVISYANFTNLMYGTGDSDPMVSMSPWFSVLNNILSLAIKYPGNAINLANAATALNSTLRWTVPGASNSLIGQVQESMVTYVFNNPTEPDLAQNLQSYSDAAKILAQLQLQFAKTAPKGLTSEQWQSLITSWWTMLNNNVNNAAAFNNVVQALPKFVNVLADLPNSVTQVGSNEKISQLQQWLTDINTVLAKNISSPDMGDYIASLSTIMQDMPSLLTANPTLNYTFNGQQSTWSSVVSTAITESISSPAATSELATNLPILISTLAAIANSSTNNIITGEFQQALVNYILYNPDATNISNLMPVYVAAIKSINNLQASLKGELSASNLTYLIDQLNPLLMNAIPRASQLNSIINNLSGLFDLQAFTSATNFNSAGNPQFVKNYIDALIQSITTQLANAKVNLTDFNENLNSVAYYIKELGELLPTKIGAAAIPLVSQRYTGLDLTQIQSIATLMMQNPDNAEGIYMAYKNIMEVLINGYWFNAVPANQTCMISSNNSTCTIPTTSNNPFVHNYNGPLATQMPALIQSYVQYIQANPSADLSVFSSGFIDAILNFNSKLEQTNLSPTQRANLNKGLQWVQKYPSNATQIYEVVNNFASYQNTIANLKSAIFTKAQITQLQTALNKLISQDVGSIDLIPNVEHFIAVITAMNNMKPNGNTKAIQSWGENEVYWRQLVQTVINAVTSAPTNIDNINSGFNAAMTTLIQLHTMAQNLGVVIPADLTEEVISILQQNASNPDITGVYSNFMQYVTQINAIVKGNPIINVQQTVSLWGVIASNMQSKSIPLFLKNFQDLVQQVNQYSSVNKKQLFLNTLASFITANKNSTVLYGLMQEFKQIASTLQSYNISSPIWQAFENLSPILNKASMPQLTSLFNLLKAHPNSPLLPYISTNITQNWGDLTSFDFMNCNQILSTTQIPSSTLNNPSALNSLAQSLISDAKNMSLTNILQIIGQPMLPKPTSSSASNYQLLLSSYNSINAIELNLLKKIMPLFLSNTQQNSILAYLSDNPDKTQLVAHALLTSYVSNQLYPQTTTANNLQLASMQSLDSVIMTLKTYAGLNNIGDLSQFTNILNDIPNMQGYSNSLQDLISRMIINQSSSAACAAQNMSTSECNINAANTQNIPLNVPFTKNELFSAQLGVMAITQPLRLVKFLENIPGLESSEKTTINTLIMNHLIAPDDIPVFFNALHAYVNLKEGLLGSMLAPQNQQLSAYLQAYLNYQAAKASAFENGTTLKAMFAKHNVDDMWSWMSYDQPFNLIQTENEDSTTALYNKSVQKFDEDYYAYIANLAKTNNDISTEQEALYKDTLNAYIQKQIQPMYSCGHSLKCHLKNFFLTPVKIFGGGTSFGDIMKDIFKSFAVAGDFMNMLNPEYDAYELGLNINETYGNSTSIMAYNDAVMLADPSLGMDLSSFPQQMAACQQSFGDCLGQISLNDLQAFTIGTAKTIVMPFIPLGYKNNSNAVEVIQILNSLGTLAQTVLAEKVGEGAQEAIGESIAEKSAQGEMMIKYVSDLSEYSPQEIRSMLNPTLYEKLIYTMKALPKLFYKKVVNAIIPIDMGIAVTKDLYNTLKNLLQKFAENHPNLRLQKIPSEEDLGIDRPYRTISDDPNQSHVIDKALQDLNNNLEATASKKSNS